MLCLEDDGQSLRLETAFELVRSMTVASSCRCGRDKIQLASRTNLLIPISLSPGRTPTHMRPVTGTRWWAHAERTAIGPSE